MARYPKSFIQRLRDEIPVSQIVGSRVAIKKKGREFEACCPFHQEKTPSFYVNDQKGFYHCFGCSAHGDSIKFLMEYEKLNYPQAIEAVAQEGGIPLPEITPEMEEKEQKRASLQEVMNLTAEWFRQQLNLSYGQAARDYLLDRGLTAQTIQHFGLGYAPADRSALKEYLAGQGVEEAQMVEGGLLIQLDDRSRPSYSRFRDRVMFPIANLQGETIAFGGRLMRKDDNAPKYLNSPETPLFHKGQVLYNWRNAKMAARDDAPVIVAEGYMDVIALHQYGFTTGVAPLGTALTENHLRSLWSVQDAPILCLDGDNAGQRAMWRSAELALPHLQPGKTLRFLTLPQGQDPDDYLKANGAKSLSKLFEQTRPLSSVIYETVMQRHGSDTPESRAAGDAELHQLCSRIQHEGVQHHFKQYFREQQYQRKRGVSGKVGQGNYRSNGKGESLPLSPAPAAPTRHDGLIRAQKELLKLLLVQPQLLSNGEVVSTLEGVEFSDPSLAHIQHWLLEEMQEPTPPVIELREDVSITLPKQAIEENLMQVWQELVDGMTLAQIDQEILALQREVTEESLQQLQALQAEKEAIEQRQYL